VARLFKYNNNKNRKATHMCAKFETSSFHTGLPVEE